MTKSLRRALVAAAGLAALQPAVAKDAPNDQAFRWMTLRIVERGYNEKPVTRDDSRRRVMMTFASADIDGDGKVVPADFDLGQRIRTAQQRAQAIAQILRDDLDGDWRVTRAEYTTAHGQDLRRPLSGGMGGSVEPTSEQVADLTRQMLERGMAPDANRDGVITLAEMAAHADTKQNRYSGGEQGLPTYLDANGDGAIARTEFTALFDRAFDSVDTNRDGSISPVERATLQGKTEAWREDERNAQREQREEQRSAELAQRCNLPKLPADAKVAVVSMYEGKGLSNVGLGGDDKEVGVARVVVEPGREKLALVLTSFEANIWLIDGAVDRLTSVVAASHVGDANGTPRIGVVGVPRSKVTLAKNTDCLGYAPGDKPNAERFGRMMKAKLGRQPDYTIADYGLGTVAVPSGKIDNTSLLPGATKPAAGGRAEAVWKVALHYNPAGIIAIDPARVVSSTKAARFAVMPQAAGLAQLVESGALEVTRSTRGYRANGTTFLGIGRDQIRGTDELEEIVEPSEYTIRKQITFPAGLNGGHSVTFVLPAGVPEPKGSPGHSKVVRGS